MAGISINSKNFEKEVLKSSYPVLVDFWAPWCGSCRMMIPIIDDITEAYSGKIKVCKINVDYESQLAQAYGVLSIPTIMLFKDGQIVKTSVGVVKKSELTSMIDSL